ncbi:hypothetical protein O6H91_11G045100 [Diphasiastrum complanatum]|uniref:Uncharacterized protein n=1 Tax=Diphasiastrum complanatum TaxID=34168 RepID=A0ACC2C8K2_DIPCM|nr:hypothetical protein O6H91_11G045100 [Diphasiastrum complanatum]
MMVENLSDWKDLKMCIWKFLSNSQCMPLLSIERMNFNLLEGETLRVNCNFVGSFLSQVWPCVEFLVIGNSRECYGFCLIKRLCMGFFLLYYPTFEYFACEGNLGVVIGITTSATLLVRHKK